VLSNRAPRVLRTVATIALLSAGSLLVASCGSSTDSLRTTTTVHTARPEYRDPAIHFYMLEAANYVYSVQLIVGRVSGIFEEVLAPAITPDHKIHDWVYRLSGSLSGQTMTYTLTSISQGAPAFRQSMTAILTAQSVTLEEPFSSGRGDVLKSTTQQLYDLAARYHVKAWTASSG
jgi:hypothetical protein